MEIHPPPPPQPPPPPLPPVDPPVLPVFVAPVPLLALPVPVVTVNVPEIHPTVSVALVLVVGDVDDMTRSTTLSQELIAPVRAVNGVLLVLYSPPRTEIMVCPPIPDIVTGLET